MADQYTPSCGKVDKSFRETPESGGAGWALETAGMWQRSQRESTLVVALLWPLRARLTVVACHTLGDTARVLCHEAWTPFAIDLLEAGVVTQLNP